MSTLLGPNTRGVLHLMSHLPRLRSPQVDDVAAEWKRQPAPARARAWAAAIHSAGSQHRPGVLSAAALARAAAMAVASERDRADWTFWAAAQDAVAAVAVCGPIDDADYQVLVAPMARALPWLAVGTPDLLAVSGLQAALGRWGGAPG